MAVLDPYSIQGPQLPRKKTGGAERTLVSFILVLLVLYLINESVRTSGGA